MTVTFRFVPLPPKEIPLTMIALPPELPLSCRSFAGVSTSVTVNDNCSDDSSSRTTWGKMLAVITGGSFTASTVKLIVAVNV